MDATCIDIDFLDKKFNRDDVSIIKVLFKGAISYEDIKVTLESLRGNERIFTVTPEDILSIKTHYINTLELKARPYYEMNSDSIDKKCIEKNGVLLKLAPSYQRDNKFVNISYYLSMEPLKRCFIGSEQANLILFNHFGKNNLDDNWKKNDYTQFRPLQI